jgi:hypothetical protein
VIFEPSVFVVGATHFSVAVPTLGAEATVIAKAVSAALEVPSLTEITMLLSVPTSALPGVPLNCPVAILKLAQLGLFCTL